MSQSNAGYRNNKYNTGGNLKAKGKLAKDEREVELAAASTPPIDKSERLASKNEHISMGRR